MPEQKKIIRAVLYGAYFIAAFLVFLLLLFPYDRVKTRLESEVKSRTQAELAIARIAPRFFNRFVLFDVVLSDRTGQVLFESPEVTAQVSLFGLVRGLPAISLRAPAYGGALSATVIQGKTSQSFLLDADNLDIGAYPLLKNAGLKINGKLGGTFEMTGGTGKGRLWLKNAATRGLTVKGVPVPDFDFEQGWIEADLKTDRLTVKRLELEGKELKVKVTGDVVLRERGSLNLMIKLKPSERLAHEQAGLLSLLKNKDAEGFYQFSLGGTMVEPMPRF